MKEKELVINVGRPFLQRTYLWSILFFVLLSAAVIFFEFSNKLDPFIIIFYILISLCLFRLVFIHGLIYRLNSKMIYVEHRFVPWQRSALWKNLKKIRFKRLFKNHFYPNGYFNVTLYFDHDDYETLLKIQLSTGLYHFKEALIYIDEILKSRDIKLEELSIKNLTYLMEKSDAT